MFLYDGKEGSTVGEVEASRGSVVSASKRMTGGSGDRSIVADMVLGTDALCVVVVGSLVERGF